MVGEVRDEVLRLISEYTEVQPGDITPQSRLQEDLGLDSIDAIEILATVEDLVHRRFSADQLQELVTVADVLERVDAALAD
ncbi:MAG: acyl carrier protein [Acidimicrobiaceae bacterium]|jgi:acyl carrier protein